MRHLEGIAAAVHDRAGVDGSVDAFDLAARLGLRVEQIARRGATLTGDDVIEVDIRSRLTRQHGLVAHELGHWALDVHGEERLDEPAARFLSGALLVPRVQLERDLRATWRLDELMHRHPCASAEMIARRICELRDAVVTVIDNGRVRARIASPWLGTPPRLSRFERELVEEALGSGDVVEAGALVHAMPLVEGNWRRVIVVAEAEQLAMRW